MTIVSLGTTGITESRYAISKMMARKYQREEKSSSHSLASVSTLARIAEFIEPGPYRGGVPAGRCEVAIRS
jgi:hypothetical protein